MNDTPTKIERMYRRMLLERSPGERLSMACRMFTTAKSLARAGILAQFGPFAEKQIHEMRSYWQE